MRVVVDRESPEFDNWVSSASGVEPLKELLSRLPDTIFFIKDGEGRFVDASGGFARMLSLASPEEMRFTSDHDHFPPAIAESFVIDDSRVMNQAECIVNKVELAYWSEAGLKWMATSKYPVFNKSGVIHGVFGITKEFQISVDQEGFFEMGGGDPRLWKAIEFLFSNFRRNPKNPEIAGASGVSERQLGRLFQQYFNTTPRNFMGLVKLDEACNRLTRSSDAIMDIALDLGMGDQSPFTAQFRKFTGTTPKKFRDRWSES